MRKVCAPSCRGAFGLVVSLVDHEQTIHSQEQLTYVPTKHCGTKFHRYLLYNQRAKNLSTTYARVVHIYDRRVPSLPVGLVGGTINKPLDCTCSSDSLCLGTVPNRSTCLCPLHRVGPRCFLPSICQPNSCDNPKEICVPFFDTDSNFKWRLCLCSL